MLASRPTFAPSMCVKWGLTIVACAAAALLSPATSLATAPSNAEQTQRFDAQAAQAAWGRQSAAMRAEHDRLARERSALRALYERTPADGEHQLTADERALMRSYYASLGTQMSAKEAVYRQRLAAHQESMRLQDQAGNATFNTFAERQRTSAQRAGDDLKAASASIEQRRQAVRLQAQRAEAARRLGQAQVQVRRAETQLDRNNQQINRIALQNEQRHAQIDAQRQVYADRQNQLSAQADALFVQRNQARERGDHVAAARLHQQGHALLQQKLEVSDRAHALHNDRAINAANARREQIWRSNEQVNQAIAQGRQRVDQMQAQVATADARKTEFKQRLAAQGMTMNARGQIVPVSTSQAQTQTPAGRPAATTNAAATAARQQQERELAQAQERLAALERQSQALAADAAARGWVSVR